MELESVKCLRIIRQFRRLTPLKSDACEVAASLECVHSDEGDLAAYSHTGQAGVFVERPCVDVGNAVRDRVFSSSCAWKAQQLGFVFVE